MHGAARAVLVGDGRSEERHHAVTGVLVDRALESVDFGRDRLEAPIHDLMDVLGVPTLGEAREAGDVGEQHRDLAALALDRGSGLEDLLRQVLGRVRGDRARGLGRRSRRRCGLSRRQAVTAGAAKAGSGPHLGVAPGTARLERRAALVAEPVRGRIVGPTGRAQHSASSSAPRHSTRGTPTS